MMVAKTILQQLGGSKFVLMTGAKNLVGSKNSLSFKIGQNCYGINAVHVELRPDDLYTMRFLRVRNSRTKGLQRDEVNVFEGVYCDQLQSLFCDATGMFTSL